MKMATAFSISSERHWQSGVNGIAKEVPKCSALPGFQNEAATPNESVCVIVMYAVGVILLSYIDPGIGSVVSQKI